MENEIICRLERVEKKHRKLKSIFFICITLLLFGLISLSYKQMGKIDIIKAKGIIIEDESGKDRILIGAPIPLSKDRVRTDTSRIRKLWANRIIPDNPDQYMKYYKDYYNSAEGIVIMNENGFDRVLLGDKLADANTGKRMYEAAGISWNDKEGFELGGAGVNTTKEGKSRSVVGLDDRNGEAVHLIALEDGTKGLVIGGENGRLLIGMSMKNGQWFQTKDIFTGIKFFDNNGKLVWEQQMNQQLRK
jgi:hypothetical protein